MILTTKKAYCEIASLMNDTFSRNCEYEARIYRQSLSARGIDETHMKRNRKAIPKIASNLYKISDPDETKVYTDSIPIEEKSALIERFNLFLEELKNFKYKKIELPYSRNLRLKLILVDYTFGNSSVAVKHRF